MEQQRLFSNQKLIKLIIPLVIEQGLTILVGMVDGVMVSAVGEAAMAGVSLVDMINAVILVLFAALATGGSVVTSQFLGAKAMEKAQRSVGQLVLMSVAMGVLIMVPCMLFDKQLLLLCFGSIESDVLEESLKYLRFTTMSFPFIALYNAGGAIFRSAGNSKISMKASMLMNVINVVGNAFCIYVLNWGVYGVAIPTLISRAAAGIYMLGKIAKPQQQLRLTREGPLHIDAPMMGNILRIGVPAACENCLVSLGRLIMASMITIYGTSQISAHVASNNIDRLGIIIGQAMGIAMVTVIGQCVGARDTEQTVYYIKKMLRWNYLAQGLMNLAIFAGADWLVSLYATLQPETHELAVQLSRIHAGFAILFYPVSFVLPNALRAASDVKFTMRVGIGSILLLRIFGSWVFCVCLGMGAMGVRVAMVLDWVARSVFFVHRTVSGKWKDKYSPQ